MTIDTILAEFGTRTGMGALRLGPQGTCRLIFDGEYIVDIEAPAGAVHLSCTVGPADADLGPAFVRRMLGANFMGRETGGAALALDEVASEVVMCRSLPTAGLTAQDFETAVEAFVAAVQVWRAEIDAQDADRPAAPVTSARPDEEEHHRLWL